MDRVFLGVDIGGMSVKIGCVTASGEILFKDNVVTDTKNVDRFLEETKNLIKKSLDRCKEENLEVLGIGFGIPGLVSNKDGLIVKMANIEGENIPLRDYLKEFNIPIKISNDANVAALAEQRFGAAKGLDNVVLLTLGTGIGGGVIIDGRLFEGTDGKGAELGHICLIYNGQKCGCGRKGCLEAYASAASLVRETKEKMLERRDSMMWDFVNGDIDKVNGLVSFECSKKGDEAAIEVIDQYISYLGEGMLDFCNIFRPEAFVIGGGISNQGDYLTDKLKKYLEDRNYGYDKAPKSDVLVAKLKNDAGIIGAASLLMN